MEKVPGAARPGAASPPTAMRLIRPPGAPMNSPKPLACERKPITPLALIEGAAKKTKVEFDLSPGMGLPVTTIGVMGFPAAAKSGAAAKAMALEKIWRRRCKACFPDMIFDLLLISGPLIQNAVREY